MQRMSWIMLSNGTLPASGETGCAVRRGAVHLYVSGCAVPDAEAFRIDVDTWRAGPEHDGSRSDRRANSIEVGVDRVTVRTSDLNVTPLYFAADSRSRRFVLGTDLALTAAAFAEVSGEPPRVMDEVGTAAGTVSPVAGVQRLEYATELRLHGGSEGWESSVHRHLPLPPDPQWQYEDPMTAGLTQIAELRKAVTEATVGVAGIGALVSGGVDSGLVAAVTSDIGLCRTAYCIGTPWGNEFRDAEELTDALGLPLRRIELTAEQVLTALPETVRFLGHAEPETVEIAVALTAFFRGRHATESHLLTGYGSDLINSGLATGADLDGDIDERIRDAVHRTRYSSEFSGMGARHHGYTLVHPYWNHRVLSTALATHPAAKASRDREKSHLRMAAETLLPATVAWRKKTAIHHGNGVGSNIGRRIDADTGRPGSAVVLYRALLIELISAVVRAPGRPLDGAELYQRAVSAVVRTHGAKRNKTLIDV